MSAFPPNGGSDSQASSSLIGLIELACSQFEAAWRRVGQSDAQPQIEDYLGTTEDPERTVLLLEMIRLDQQYRRQLGVAPTEADYAARFPALDPTWLDRVLSAANPPPPAPPTATVDFQPSGALADPRSTLTYDPGPAPAQETTDLAAPVSDETVQQKPSLTARRPQAYPLVPRYEILDELGRGGMGVVYKARQVGLERLVALKMILSGAHARPNELERFRIEGLAVAKIKHPNIVQIYDVDEQDGLPYFSLEFIEGGSLASALKGKPMAPRAAAELCVKLARAMAVAHDKKIIHRDLKPANILMTTDGQPKITDFGLAKRLEDDSAQTRTGDVMGTPSYMAPEQAWGRIDQLGPAADIYSLGAILYETVTGRPPFQGVSVLDTLDQVRNREPVPPLQLQPRVDPDLDTIILKCLQKEPQRRYASATDLADDLQRFLDGRPILARPVSQAERAWRWARRNPYLAGLGSAVAALLLTIAVVSSLLSWQLNIQRNIAVTQKGIAEERKTKAEALAKSESEAKAREQVARKQAEDNAKVTAEQRNLALDAIRGMLVQVQDVLRTKPELTPLREKIVQSAMADFDKVKDHAARNPLQDRLEAQGLTKMGDIALDTNRLKESLQQYDRAAAILDRFARDFPDDSVGPRNLAAITNKRAEVLIRLGDANQARDLYRQALTHRERWALMEPNHLPARQAIAISHNNLGNVNLLLGDPETAQTHFEAMLAAYRDLPEEAKRTPAIRREIALGEAMVAEALLKQGKRAEAEKRHRESLKLREDLLKLGTNNRTLVRDVAASHLYLGDLFQTSAGDPVAAWPEYSQTLKDFTRLQKADPEGVGPRRDLALILYRVGVTAQRLNAAGKTDAVQPPPASPKSYFEQCREIREGLARLDPNDSTARIDWMLALARCGRTAEAEKLARGLVEQAKGDTRLLFQAACGLATASETANAESAPNLRDQAFQVLNDLIAHGWKDRAALETDPDLEGVRPDPRFAPLLAGLPPAARRP